MARHPWVAQADEGVRWGIQVSAIRRRPTPLDVTLHDDPLRVLMDAGRLVEELGFDGLFLHDHPSFSPDPWTGLAALAAVTERVMLGSVVVCVPYRHPTFLARLSTDIDNISRGRFMLGLGVGWAEPEFRALGVEVESIKARQESLEEAVTIVKDLWSGEPVTFAGKHYQLDNVQIAPRPIQQPRPPVMIAGPGRKVTLRQVARHADACNIGEPNLAPDVLAADPDAPLAYLRGRLDVLRQHCADAGRPYDEVLKTHFVPWMILAPTEAEVRDKVRAFFGDSPGGAARNAVAGTPEQVVAHYQARADIGFQYFVVQIYDGTDHETLRLLASEVMPHVT